MNAGGSISAQPYSNATGWFPARNLLSFLQPSDSRSPGCLAQNCITSCLEMPQMPHPAPWAVLSLPHQGLSLPGQGFGMDTVTVMVPGEQSRDPGSGDIPVLVPQGRVRQFFTRMLSWHLLRGTEGQVPKPKQQEAEMLCSALVTNLPSELQKLPGISQAGVSRDCTEERALHPGTAPCSSA